jgi:hypothetical protein
MLLLVVNVPAWVNSGSGEGVDAMGGANEDNQNAMREAQVFNPEIAGAEGVSQNKTKVSSQNIEEVVEPGEFDQGTSRFKRLTSYLELVRIKRIKMLVTLMPWFSMKMKIMPLHLIPLFFVVRKIQTILFLKQREINLQILKRG